MQAVCGRAQGLHWTDASTPRHAGQPSQSSEIHWGYIGIMEKMETTIVYWGSIGIMENKMDFFYSILWLFWDNGKYNGLFYSILGLYWDNGK